MIEPYIIRQRLLVALQVPRAHHSFLHAWATVENRRFGHDLMGNLLGCLRSDGATRQFVRREIDWYLDSKLNLGTIRRGGGTKKEITHYGSSKLNSAAQWIQKQIDVDLDRVNPFVTIDRYVPQAIEMFSLNVATCKAETKNKPKKRRRVRGYRDLSCDKFVGLKNLSELGTGALKIARELKLPVFPCHVAQKGSCSCKTGAECESPGKHPAVSRWQQVATTYEPSIGRHWTRFPFANIGLLTGSRLPNGEYLLVVDVDFKSFGHGVLAALESDVGVLPTTREHSSGAGFHRYYASPILFPSKAGILGRGVDIKCRGGYVVAPPSRHANGNQYQITADLPIVTLPEPWVAYIQALWNKKLDPIRVGERHAYLLKCAGGIIADGLRGEAAIAALRDRRDMRCESPGTVTDGELQDLLAYCANREALRVGEAQRAA